MYSPNLVKFQSIVYQVNIEFHAIYMPHVASALKALYPPSSRLTYFDSRPALES